MTRVELRAFPGLSDWVAQGVVNGYFFRLIHVIDDEIGDNNLLIEQEFQANMELGRQQAIRQIKNFFRDPLGHDVPTAVKPAPNYGLPSIDPANRSPGTDRANRSQRSSD